MANTASPKSQSSALRFYAVLDADNFPATPSVALDGVTLVTMRDLAAAVAPTEYVRVTPGDTELDDYVRVVDELYALGPVVPAPPGTVFRDAGVLRHWLEIHYAKLHEALEVIERRGGPNPPYDFVRMELGA